MTAPALTFDDPNLATDNLNLLSIRPKVRAAAIYNDHGVLFATYSANNVPQQFPKQPGPDSVTVDGKDLIVFKRIVKDGVNLGTVYLLADYGLSERILDHSGIAVIVMLSAMLIAFLMMTGLEQVVTRPILAIANVAREVVEQHDYSRRAEKISIDEAGALVDSFNKMLDEIERRTRELENSYQQIAREAEERSRAQQEVMRLNAELEQRVRERTAQLEASNRELELAKATAEQANQAKSAFLSSMSHELRTPLNAILGFSQILTSDSMPSTLAQKKEFANHILKAGRHLLTLINEILDLAKIESGTMTLSLEPVSLAEVLRECETIIAPMGSQRGIRVQFPSDIHLNVVSDRTRLKQVLLNLLSNAVKYNREHGTVIIECMQHGNGRVRIAVQDTGAGLGEDQLKALFQPFNRLGQEGGPEEGTGIGLVVTKHLVELMGGEIGVSSSVGSGSVFWIELKTTASTSAGLVDETGGSEVDVAGADDNGRRAILLYIEDNPANLKLVEEIVRFRGDLRLLSAPDAHLGIDLATIHQPDVILMDIHLPGMSGTEAMKILRSTPKTGRIPVIALTANAMPREIDKGIEAGFFRYITKPINLAEFNAAVNSALEVSAKSA
jgi:signal transduction histidine kinase/CheY-like chemotaxis protein